MDDPKPARTIEGSNDGETWTTIDPMASSEGYMYLRTRHGDGLVHDGRCPEASPVTWGELAELVEASLVSRKQFGDPWTHSLDAGSLMRLLRERAEGKR